MKWHSAPLGSVAEIQLGKMLSGKASKGVAPAPYLRNANVQWGRLVLDDLLEMDFSPVERQKFSLVPGDLLVCEGGEPGRCAVVTEELDGVYYQKALMRVRPHSERLTPAFLQRFMQHAASQGVFRKGGNQSTIAHFPAIRLNALEVPLPPLHEQKRIAAILDATETLRFKRRSSIADLDSLVQSAFLDMFGDPLTNPKGWPVGVVGDLLASANYGTSKKPHDTDGAFPVLRMNNITYQGGWDFSSLKYVDLTAAEQSKYLVQQGQLLFNRTNSKELVGKTAVYRRATPVAFAGYLVRAIVNEHADGEYVGAFMNTVRTKAYLRSRCKNIIGMANINAQEFQAIPVPKPPVELQRRFAGIVGSIERQRDQLMAQLSELDKLFASLQSRAFSGALCSSPASRDHASA